MEDFYSVLSIRREDKLVGRGNVEIDLNFSSYKGEISQVELESNDINTRYMYQRAGTEVDDANQRAIWGPVPP